MRLLACGDKAILVELEDAGERRQLEEALRRDPVSGVLEHVPAARTVLVRAVSADQVPAIALRLRGDGLTAIVYGWNWATGSSLSERRVIRCRSPLSCANTAVPRF